METLLYELADEVRERALTNGVSRLECPSCNQAASIADPDGIAHLVEHARRGHSTVQSLLGIHVSVAMSPYEITSRLGEDT